MNTSRNDDQGWNEQFNNELDHMAMLEMNVLTDGGIPQDILDEIGRAHWEDPAKIETAARAILKVYVFYDYTEYLECWQDLPANFEEMVEEKVVVELVKYTRVWAKMQE